MDIWVPHKEKKKKDKTNKGRRMNKRQGCGEREEKNIFFSFLTEKPLDGIAQFRVRCISDCAWKCYGIL